MSESLVWTMEPEASAFSPLFALSVRVAITADVCKLEYHRSHRNAHYNVIMRRTSKEIRLVSRKKRLEPGARPTTVYLTPGVELALNVIEKRRRARGDSHDSPSEIISDAIWKHLHDVEGIQQDQITKLLPQAAASNVDNLKKFPTKP
jgi:hypothetical protein